MGIFVQNYLRAHIPVSWHGPVLAGSCAWGLSICTIGSPHRHKHILVVSRKGLVSLICFYLVCPLPLILPVHFQSTWLAYYLESLTTFLSSKLNILSQNIINSPLFETGFYCVVQADLKISILLTQSPECWNDRPHQHTLLLSQLTFPLCEYTLIFQASALRSRSSKLLVLWFHVGTEGPLFPGSLRLRLPSAFSPFMILTFMSKTIRCIICYKPHVFVVFFLICINLVSLHSSETCLLLSRRLEGQGEAVVSSIRLIFCSCLPVAALSNPRADWWSRGGVGWGCVCFFWLHVVFCIVWCYLIFSLVWWNFNMGQN